MLGLYYAPGACSMAAHIVLEESGEKYEPIRLDLAKGEQRSDAYLKLNPLGRVPVLRLDDGTPVSENTAILPYLGKRFGLWPADALGEAQLLSLIGYFAAAGASGLRPCRPARALLGRSLRLSRPQGQGPQTFHGYLKDIDARLAGREWLSDRYSAADPYALVFYAWGKRRELPVGELKNYTAFKDRMLQRPAVQRTLADEQVKL